MRGRGAWRTPGRSWSVEILRTICLHRRKRPATTTTTTTSTKTTASVRGRVLCVENGLGSRLGLENSGFLHLEERASLEKIGNGGLEGDEVHDCAIRFGQAVKGLENKLFIRDGMANIG